MRGKEEQIGGLHLNSQTYEKKCFIGHSQGAPWCLDLMAACQEVLSRDEFGLEPWYAESHINPDKSSLLETVVDMIANARYGIYDLSYWRKDNKGEWVMPHNVFLELGMAIALNRPILLLQREGSQQNGPKLPECLEGIRDRILLFTGKYDLKKELNRYLPQWVIPLDDWRNRYCDFGKLSCEYREAHPLAKYWGQQPLQALIVDDPPLGQANFHWMVEEVLANFHNITPSYMSQRSPLESPPFQLCTYCHAVRTSPFTIYRLTSDTPSETFITLGISIALSIQFKYPFPKVLLANKQQDMPSLIAGEKASVEKDDVAQQNRLRAFLPPIIHMVRSKRVMRPVPLPFIDMKPMPPLKPVEMGGGKSPEDTATNEETGEKVSSRLSTNGTSWKSPLLKVKIARDKDGRDYEVQLVAMIWYQLDSDNAHIADQHVLDWETSVQEKFVSELKNVFIEVTPEEMESWRQPAQAQPAGAINATGSTAGRTLEDITHSIAKLVKDEVEKWGVEVRKVDIPDLTLMPNLAPRPNPTRPVAGAQTGAGSSGAEPIPVTSNRTVDQQTTIPLQFPPASGYPPHSDSEIEMLKEAYEAVRIGRIRDPQTIRGFAARFEEHVYDPNLDFYPLRAAEILYSRARFYEEQNDLNRRTRYYEEQNDLNRHAPETVTVQKDRANVTVKEEKSQTSVTVDESKARSSVTFQFVADPEAENIHSVAREDEKIRTANDRKDELNKGFGTVLSAMEKEVLRKDVPNLLKLDLFRAAEQARELGMNVVPIGEDSSDANIEPGLIVSQDPSPGTPVKFESDNPEEKLMIRVILSKRP